VADPCETGVVNEIGIPELELGELLYFDFRDLNFFRVDIYI
jgi:hypothetical protein